MSARLCSKGGAAEWGGVGRGGWQGLGAVWEQLLPVEGLLYQGSAIRLLAWQTEEPLLISGALGWLV